MGTHTRKGRTEKDSDQILHRLVRLSADAFFVQFRHNGVRGIDLRRFLGHHVRSHRVVGQRLRLHDTLHVDRPTVL